jgi:peptidoglycan hydrolase FlgJ
MSMSISPPGSTEIPPAPTSRPPAAAANSAPLRQAFDQFVGESLFGQMLKSMRATVGKPAYFHGGRAEEIFTQQLDQVLAEKLSQASADKISGPMYELFTLERK